MHLPHVVPFIHAPLYFFTACTAGRRALLGNTQAYDCLRDIWQRSAALDGWCVGRFVLMPDHVHFFALPSSEAKTRADWHKTWKSISSRRIANEQGVTPPVWQSDVFDHLLRRAESYREKWDYVRHNPVRAGLVAQVDEWPWQGEIYALDFRSDAG
jgi:putative transposase